MARQEFDTIKTKDQLGKPDELAIFGPFKLTENFLASELPTITFQRQIAGFSRWGAMEWGTDNWYYVDASFILGNNPLAKLGTAKLGTTTEAFEIVRVENYNDTFKWRFTHEDSVDTKNFPQTVSWTDSANSTATEDIVNLQVDFTAGQVWQSKPAFKDSSSSKVVIRATLSATVDSGSFDYELSADGGSNWESVTLDSEHTFTNQGSDLRIKITEGAGTSFPTAFGTWGSGGTGTITFVSCTYTI